MSLKIGLVGASCTGKTTLSEEISNLFNLEIIGETARELFNEFNISSPRNLETLSDELKFQNRILDVKSQSESKLPNFVADRTFVDAAAYWLFHLSKKTSDEQSYSYLKKCQDLMKNYHVVIFLSYERLGGCLVDDGVRTGRIYYNYSMHLLMKGILFDWSIPYFLLSSSNNTEAIDFIERQIGKYNGR